MRLTFRSTGANVMHTHVMMNTSTMTQVTVDGLARMIKTTTQDKAEDIDAAKFSAARFDESMLRIIDKSDC